jgi:hypothetical protein
MKNKIKFSLILLFTINTLVYGQFGDLLNKTSNKVKSKIEKKADNAVDKALDKDLNKNNSKPNTSNSENADSKNNSNSTNTNTSNSNTTPSNTNNPSSTNTSNSNSTSTNNSETNTNNEAQKEAIKKTELSKTEKQENTLPGKFYFASTPFKDGTDIAKAKTNFTAGDEIYGMVVMEKNFNEYNFNAEQNFGVTFYASIRVLAGRGSTAYMSLESNIHAKYNAQNYLFFDVNPEPSKALSYSEYNFMRIGNLFATVDDPATSTDKPKIGYVRTYDMTFKIGYKEYGDGEITIDYTNATRASMKTWLEKDVKAWEMAKTNVLKNNENEAINVASSLPLPKSFSETGGNAYAAPNLNKANIIAMLNKMEEVKQVLKFMFLKTTATTDFELYKTPLGIPDYKWGNRYFQFIFKDAAGKCLAAGGRIQMNYEGGGKYGAPFIIWELASIESDEKYLQDNQLKAYVVDCNKVK